MTDGSAIGEPRPGDGPTETLVQVAIFRDLEANVVEALSRRCAWRRYDAGQTILQRQDQTRDVFFIVRGKVCAVHHSADGRETRLSDLDAGEVFGEFAAIDGKPRSASVVAVADSLIASMPPGLFWEVLHRHPPVCAAILRRLTRVARLSTQRVVEFCTLPMRSRLQAELLRLARIGACASNRTFAVIAPAPTHADLASRIGSHREAVTRQMNELARAKLIEKRGRTLVILDVAALASLLEEASGEPCGEVGGSKSRSGDERELDRI